MGQPCTSLDSVMEKPQQTGLGGTNEFGQRGVRKEASGGPSELGAGGEAQGPGDSCVTTLH